jgi:RNA polymerase sigma-70 factor (ECF subfamily)
MTVPEISSHEITELLVDWNNGNNSALEKLMPLVYRELRRLARQYLRNERAGHTLQTTDLVHEAYFRLVDQQQVQWQNRAHFYGIAAQLMRRILIDHARRGKRAKRGGGAQMVTLEPNVAVSPQFIPDILDLDQALKRLAEIDVRKARIVELRFFGGLEVKETAAFLNVSEVTVIRDWKMAKAWLHRELSPK